MQLPVLLASSSPKPSATSVKSVPASVSAVLTLPPSVLLPVDVLLASTSTHLPMHASPTVLMASMHLILLLLLPVLLVKMAVCFAREQD